MNLCGIDNCNKKVHAHGLCQRHYEESLMEINANYECVEEGCSEEIYSSGLCRSHFEESRTKSKDICKVPSCDRQSTAGRGLCRVHYTKYYRSVGGVLPCSVEGCQEPPVFHGMCIEHHGQFRTPEGKGVICSFPECNEFAVITGLCKRHYNLKQVHKDKGICRIEGCSNKADLVGLCTRHYEQSRADKGHICTEPGCTRGALKRGMCKNHYDEYRRIIGISEVKCLIKDCEMPSFSYGLCYSHFQQKWTLEKRHGQKLDMKTFIIQVECRQIVKGFHGVIRANSSGLCLHDAEGWHTFQTWPEVHKFLTTKG